MKLIAEIDAVFAGRPAAESYVALHRVRQFLDGRLAVLGFELAAAGVEPFATLRATTMHATDLMKSMIDVIRNDKINSPDVALARLEVVAEHLNAQIEELREYLGDDEDEDGDDHDDAPALHLVA